MSDVRIRLRQGKKEQREHARLRQDERTGDVIVTVRAGLLTPEAWHTMRKVLELLSDNYHPGLPEPVRRRLAAETRREIDEQVAKMTPDERARHEAERKAFDDYHAQLDAIAVAS